MVKVFLIGSNTVVFICVTLHKIVMDFSVFVEFASTEYNVIAHLLSE